jgi:hypothetical protein
VAADSPRRYRALAHIIVGGRVLYEPGEEFMTSDTFGDALLREGRAELLRPINHRSHKRRDVRPEGDK